MAIEREDDFYLALSLNEQMMRFYEEIERAEREWNAQSQMLYFLMRGYDGFHDGDEWIGLYDNIWKLRAAYREAVGELEEEHKKCIAEGLRVTHERVMIHAFDQAEKRWKYNIPYETLFAGYEDALSQGLKIPQFLKTVEER